MTRARNALDLSGQRFGKWTVLSLSRPGKLSMWLCCCDCGAERAVMTSNLRSGRSKSCGKGDCFSRSTLRHGCARHGAVDREYANWQGMLARCRNPNHSRFNSYGGRGITVCERWQVFENFVADMGPRPDGATIDRIDNDGNYEPGNCRWATLLEQRLNNRHVVWLENGGERMPLKHWAQRLGINPASLAGRLRRGWPLEKALTTGATR